MLISALLHPFRDLGLKSLRRPASAYFGVAAIWVIIAGAQAALLGKPLWLPAAAWTPAVFSAVGLGVYYHGTLSALQRGHLSVYYPIIRSAPLAIVVLNWALFGTAYPAPALLGIGLVLISGFLIQKPSGRLFGDARALSFAIAAMIGSAVYTMADAVAMRHAEPSTFLLWIYAAVSCQLGVACVAGKRTDDASLFDRLFGAWRLAPLRIVLAGITSYASYAFILSAFQLGSDAAYVSAIRQASIPVSVILAYALLGEPRGLPRLGWACLLAIGIAIIVTG